jgi:hypothetical protein
MLFSSLFPGFPQFFRIRVFPFSPPPWLTPTISRFVQTLYPWQEAAADLYSHPWHPDLWALCNILAERQSLPNELPDISGNSPGSSSLLPHFSAAEMLWTPILARGAGLQLKRTPPPSPLPPLSSQPSFSFVGLAFTTALLAGPPLPAPMLNP